MTTRKTRPERPLRGRNNPTTPATKGAQRGMAMRSKKKGKILPLSRIDPDGIPVVPELRVLPEVVERLARRGYSDQEIFAFVVPKRTLMRRRANKQPLSVEETDKALRLDRVASQASRVFGDDAKAYRWLRKPKRQLSGETPLAFLASEAGARVVEAMLYRIEHGIFA